MDPLVKMAREAHRKASEHVQLAGHYRAQRDRAICQLYATGDYSYTTLAKQTEISRELVVKIVQCGRPSRRA